MKHRFKLSFKGKIFACFVLCCFCVVVLRQNLEAIYLALLKPGDMAWETNTVSEKVFFAAGLLVFALGAFVFYRLTSRIIRAESERRVREQNLIYAAIAHDLKTPMTSVQGYAAALRDGVIPPEKQAEALDIIHAKSRRMNELVDSLFEYASLGTEEYHLKKEPVDAAKVVREIAADHYRDFEDRGIDLDVDIPDGPVTILGDAREFRRAVTNLVVNAWKHNESGAKVRVALKAANGQATVSIADTGAAIAPEQREGLFKPFVTADAARQSSGGSGLGLAIASKIIAEMGGRIDVVDGPAPYTKAFVISGLRSIE